MPHNLPGAILFVCTRNSVRSPMAEALLKQRLGQRVYIDSVGVREGDIDGFAATVMQEIGIDLTRHRAKTFEDLHDTSFDLVVTLSPEAHHRALEMTRTMACEVEYWPTFDATMVEGRREERLAAFRAVRDQLRERICRRFAAIAAPRP
ncbi:MAG: arsenate reductase ArsC [Thalassobaculales bacterium]